MMTDHFSSPYETTHLPVLLTEVLHYLQPLQGGRYVDGTLGAGGHSAAILSAGGRGTQLLGLDLDPLAINLASQKLAQYSTTIHLFQSSYANLSNELTKIGWDTVDGILLDLGISSMQIDTATRGFSFLKNGPLDMRFGPSIEEDASDLINTSSENDLADLIRRFGEEPQARKIAAAIIKARPVSSSVELAAVIEKAKPRTSGIHPATRTFQALRIAVNQELVSLAKFLPQALQSLKTGGRLVIISYHSLEDRIVKEFFRQEAKDCICPPEQPVCTCNHKASLSILTRHPVIPGEEEIRNNPRSRSGRLRAVEKRLDGITLASTRLSLGVV